MTRGTSGRRHDIDWLRVFATYLLFVFHVAMVFNPAPFYHIRNDEQSFSMFVLCGFVSLWHMPLFFLLAGWSMCSSLDARGTGGFLKERLFRLAIPFGAACVLLMPPIKFLELSSGMNANLNGLSVAEELQESFMQIIGSRLPVMEPFDESYLEFLPTFFTQPDRFTWAHLWFVAYLLTFSLLLLPLFLLLRRRPPVARRIGPLRVYLPILPLAAVQVFLRPYWPGLQNLYDDWANVSYYTTFMTAGFLLARHPTWEAAVHREWKRALAIGLLATLALLLGVLEVYSSTTTLLALSAVAGWCFVVALLGWAHQRFNFSNGTLAYFSESAFPVYLLHQSAIVMLGYPLIRLDAGIGHKFLVLLLISTAATLTVYHLVVRRFAVTRFLFGMKPQRDTRSHSRLSHSRPAVGTSAAACLGVLIAMAPAYAEAQAPEGTWYAEGGAAKVEVRACGEDLCGRIVWLRSPLDENGCTLRDRQNPDPARRDRPVVGLQVLRGLKRVTDREPVWDGGTIYDPGSGDTYSVRLTVEDEDRLKLRGYLGIPLLGRTTRWLRVGAENEMCRDES